MWLVCEIVFYQSMRRCGYIFLLQAEDGIRYLGRSRGLGDVYKRQVDAPRLHFEQFGPRQPHHRRRVVQRLRRPSALATELHVAADIAGEDPVSYTHLPLPTRDLV